MRAVGLVRSTTEELEELEELEKLDGVEEVDGVDGVDEVGGEANGDRRLLLKATLVEAVGEVLVDTAVVVMPRNRAAAMVTVSFVSFTLFTLFTLL